MTVMICIPCLLCGGTEVQTLSLVRAMAARGHRVVVVCYFEHDATVVAAYRDGGSEVVLLSCSGARGGVLRQVATLARGLRSALRKYRPDIVHVQYMAPGTIPILLLRLMGARTVVATIHTSADVYGSTGRIRMLCRSLVKAMTFVSTGAEAGFFGDSLRYSPGMAVSGRRHFTISNPLPPHIHVAASGRDFSHAVLTVGVVARLEHIKGVDTVIPALAPMAAAGSIRILVVGDGSMRDLLKQQAAELAVDDAVSMVGAQSIDRMQQWYDRIDILLVPSRSEGFGLVAVEGMARGCVVLAADLPALASIVDDGVSGLLYRAGDGCDMREKLAALVSDRVRMGDISDNGRHAAGSYGFETYGQAVEALYLKVLADA